MSKLLDNITVDGLKNYLMPRVVFSLYSCEECWGNIVLEDIVPTNHYLFCNLCHRETNHLFSGIIQDE